MSSNQRPVIIKRIEEDGHEGHHGGAWKVAYADFMTAMMAFFLLMWILSSSDEEQLKGLADYFSPSLAQTGGPGGDGVMDGVTLGDPGTLSSSTRPMQEIAPTTPGTRTAPELPEERALARAGETEGAQEAAGFDAVEAELRAAIAADPALRPLEGSVVFQRTAEGLEIVIIDQQGREMFATGSAAVTGEAEALLTAAGRAIAGIDAAVMIAGHTDSVPFSRMQGYGNWELSSDRAHATRRVLAAAGVAPERIARVSGLADTDPLLPEDPAHPSNRRISILLRDGAAATTQAAAQTTAPARAPAPAAPRHFDPAPAEVGTQISAGPERLERVSLLPQG